MIQSTPTSKKASAGNQQVDPEEFPTVHFDDRLWELAKGIAHVRKIVYDQFDGGTIYGSNTSYESHLKGTMGELAVAEYFDELHVEDVTALHHNGDPGWDLEVKEGTIDVKATGTWYPLPDLIVPADPKPVADFYILAHRVSEREVRLVGMAVREQVTEKPARREPGKRLNHIVPPEELLFFD